jgi:hypothetical protein
MPGNTSSMIGGITMIAEDEDPEDSEEDEEQKEDPNPFL